MTIQDLAEWVPLFGSGVAAGAASVLVVHFGMWPLRLVYQLVRGIVR